MKALKSVDVQSFDSFAATFNWKDISFWNNNHALKPVYDKLWDELVPEDGKCETIEGECLRASSRLAYDCFNNGFCNNTSGALKWLVQEFDHPEMIRVATMLAPYTNGFSGESVGGVVLVDYLAQEVTKAVAAVETYTPNSQDLFSLQDPDDWGDEEDDEWEDDYDGWYGDEEEEE